MPTGLELLAAHYAKPSAGASSGTPRRKRDGLVPPTMDEEDPLAPPVDPDLNNPSALESVLKTIGMGAPFVEAGLPIFESTEFVGSTPA